VSDSRILEYEPGDLTCIVDATLRLSELQNVLAAQGQRLSLDPPGDPTLARCVLDDLSGPLRHRFGRIGDLLIGITVVLADGTRASSGGRVVKNVAGYDLGKLFCGSRGRLGSVERVALRLHPAPAVARTGVLDSSRWPELHHSQVVPSAVDLVDGRLHVLIEGSERSVERQLASLAGEEADPDSWNAIRELQARLPGRRRWEGEDAPLIRPGPRVAHVEEVGEQAWSPLAQRVVEAFCATS
jgi:glycolate oxidase FAD binding subunit